jgi:hypothetical protein
MKKTKQGVRDLNYIKAPPRGIRLEMPPQLSGCAHKQTKVSEDGVETCMECKTSWDVYEHA